MKCTVYIFLLLLFSIKLLSQSPNLIFHNLNERQGLSANYCYSLLKDSRGMLWVGTINGLSRFDGVHFHNFKLGNDSTTLLNGEIYDLCEDKEGNIWGGTGNSIFCYNTKINRFKHFIPPTYDYVKAILNIICDQHGTIWATSGWNIFKFNKQKNSFQEIGPLTKDKDSLMSYSVRQNGLVEDPSGKGLWFTTRFGLHYYNIAEDQFYNFKNSLNDSLFTNHGVAALTLSASGNFWFFDNVTKEIISFNPSSHKILVRINMDTVFPNSYGMTLFEDHNHLLWFSTWMNKMAVIDYRNKTIKPFAYRDNTPLSIAGDGFWDVFEDDDYNLCFATPGGMSTCNYLKNVYAVVPIVEKIPEFKNSNLAAFSIDPKDKSWWLANDGNISIIRYYPETGNYDFFDFSKAKKNSKGQLPGQVFSINFMNGLPYACTSNGIWQLHESSKHVTPFEKIVEDLPAAYHFTEYGNTVWFTTIKGYVKWDKVSNRYIIIKASSDTLPDGQTINYGRLYIDRTGRPWFAPGYGWLAHINEKNKIVSKYYIKNKIKEMSGYLYAMTDDHYGNLWMASLGVGLYRYTLAKDKVKLYGQLDGISNFISSVVMDNDHRLWISASNKFAIYNLAKNHMSHYNLPLYENILNYRNIMISDSNGDILATLNKVIVKFIPERLDLKPVIKAPLVSMIKISGKETLISDETTLTLEPNDNSLEFNFGSFINNEIFPHIVEYKLEGFDDVWIRSNSSATALYNKLEPGEYIFKVRARAENKSWQTPERIIKLTIRTPFYKAAWFWLLIGIILVSALIFFYWFRLNKQKQIFILETKAQLLEKEKTMVSYESLKQQLNPHFLFNSLTSLSGLIVTDQDMASEFLDQMSGIYRYILKNGDHETVTLKEEIEFVKLYIDLQQTRFKRGLQVNVSIPGEYDHYKIAPVSLQNMIENAIKHNIIDPDSPLIIDIVIEKDYIVIKNNLQKKDRVESSNKKGLAQFAILYRYLTTKPILIEESTAYFIIKIPLI